MQKIILIGYMGSGKSTLAQLLSKKLSLEYVDLDTLIEKETKETIKSLFEKGELYFRKVEHEKFKQLVNDTNSLIISTGGGTPCYANNHTFLNGQNIVSIYLKGSIETLASRLQNEKEHRPLIATLSTTDLKEYIAKSLFERSFYYQKATHQITIDNKSIEMLLKEIVQLLN